MLLLYKLIINNNKCIKLFKYISFDILNHDISTIHHIIINLQLPQNTIKCCILRQSLKA